MRQYNHREFPSDAQQHLSSCNPNLEKLLHTTHETDEY
jgi:hypothetical protein